LSTTEPPPLGVFTQRQTLGDYGCRPLKETATKLAKNPKATKAQLCLADFMRANGFDQNQLDWQPEAHELGGTQSLFKGAPFARFDIYKSLIASSKTPAEDKAYALFRAVRCYAPVGSNDCGGVEVSLAVRRGWFNRLHAQYPQSRWARELKYYW